MLICYENSLFKKKNFKIIKKNLCTEGMHEICQSSFFPPNLPFFFLHSLCILNRKKPQVQSLKPCYKNSEVVEEHTVRRKGQINRFKKGAAAPGRVAIPI